MFDSPFWEVSTHCELTVFKKVWQKIKWYIFEKVIIWWEGVNCCLGKRNEDFFVGICDYWWNQVIQIIKGTWKDKLLIGGSFGGKCITSCKESCLMDSKSWILCSDCEKLQISFSPFVFFGSLLGVKWTSLFWWYTSKLLLRNVSILLMCPHLLSCQLKATLKVILCNPLI